jgi:hypothetical protein
MDLIRGRQVHHTGRATEEMYRFPADEERWEVTCSEAFGQEERDEREVPAEPRRRDLPIAS